MIAIEIPLERAQQLRATEKAARVVVDRWTRDGRCKHCGDPVEQEFSRECYVCDLRLALKEGQDG